MLFELESDICDLGLDELSRGSRLHFCLMSLVFQMCGTVDGQNPA